jgi:hypothetical protein
MLDKPERERERERERNQNVVGTNLNDAKVTFIDYIPTVLP